MQEWTIRAVGLHHVGSSAACLAQEMAIHDLSRDEELALLRAENEGLQQELQAVADRVQQVTQRTRVTMACIAAVS